MDESFDILAKLSKDLCDRGCYLQAAKCLEAASSISTAPPHDRALLLLDYATLLIDHFDNLDRAKTVLLQAERELRSVRGHDGLRCDLFHLLAKCYRMQGDQSQAILACQNGLNFCNKKGKASSQWRLYFLLCKAECQLQEDPNAALETLTAIYANPVTASKVESALIALGCATVSLHIGNLEEADKFLTCCANAIEEAGSCDNDVISLKQLSGFYFLTYAIIAQTVGRMTQLQEGSEYPIFVRLQESLHDELANQDLWLPSPAASALGHLLHCSVLRSHGKGSAAAIHLGQAEEIIDQGFEHCKVCWTKSENEYSMPTLFESKTYLQLKAVALEQQALSALMSVDLSGAAGHCLDLISSLQRFPSILRSRSPSVCIVFGHYMFAVNEFGLASDLFASVLDISNAKHLHRLAALALCLSIIQMGDDGKAKHTLQGLQHLNLNEPLELHGLRSHERAAAQFLHGIIVYQSGDSTGARMLLTKALKQAHTFIGSAQLVGQILNVLAPIQRDKDDTSGAKQMLESATTLLKSVGDLPCLIYTLQMLYQLNEDEKQGQLLQMKEYLTRKTVDWHMRLKNVSACGKHNQLLELCPWLIKFLKGR